MSDKLKVIISNEQKRVKIETGIRMLLRRCCHAVLEEEGFVGSAEIEIFFNDNEGFKASSIRYHGIMYDPEAVSVVFEINPADRVKKPGKVIISVEQASRNAREMNMAFNTRLAFLTAHCVLELLGYPEGRKRNTEKNAKVELILHRLGLTYAPNYL